MSDRPRVVVTGMGIVTSIGHDLPSFTNALRRGDCGIDTLNSLSSAQTPPQVGAEIRDFSWESFVQSLNGSDSAIRSRALKVLKNAPDSTRLSACSAIQAYRSAGLNEKEVAAEEIGLIVAGNNISQKYIAEAWKKFQQVPDYINPRFAISFFDTKQVGCVSEILRIHGLGFTVGGASASGNLAILNGLRWVESGAVRYLLVCGACAEFTALELQAFSILGAMSGETFSADPRQACRPFDRRHDGFVYGQGTACIVLESAASARARGAQVFGEVAGAGMILDGNHLAQPSVKGEAKAMLRAIADGGIEVSDVDYVNAHGSSSPLGDEYECAALREVFGVGGKRPWVNSTKSLTGHCMYAAGVIELIACAVQVNHGFLHPNLNLEEPIAADLRFVGQRAQPAELDYALSNSFGFGGINSSVLLKKWRSESADDFRPGPAASGGGIVASRN